jgi:hypothetical protein
MGAVARLLARAEGEVGYLEKSSNSQLDSKTANAGRNNYTKYARDLDALGVVYNTKKNGYAWCDIFTDWCFIMEFGLETAMKMLNQSYKGLGAGCEFSARYFKNAGRFYTSDPQPGDQIFFTDGSEMYHTGIVYAVDKNYVYTIEGNTSSASGVVDNGGCVAKKHYALSYTKIGGYGRPDWSIAEAEPEGWVKDEKGWWYRRADGTWPSNGWEEIGGKLWRFDESGYLYTSTTLIEGKTLYTFDENGYYTTEPIKEAEAAEAVTKPDVTGQEDYVMETRYHLLSEVTSKTYRATLDDLIRKGILQGKGGEGENLILDLGEDAIRVLVYLDRAGVFD